MARLWGSLFDFVFSFCIKSIMMFSPRGVSSSTGTLLCGPEIPSEIFTDRKIHFRTLRSTVTKWMNNKLLGATEKWIDFSSRVKNALDFSCDLSYKQVLVVTSGGPISRVVSTTLNTPKEEMMNLNLQIKNTSISRFIFTPRSFYLHSFNSTPQFDGDKSSYMTYS